MVSVGDRAPVFSAPMATLEHAAGGRGEDTGDHVEQFSLDEALDDKPIILAFSPGSFHVPVRPNCATFAIWMHDLANLDADVYGVSVDAPFGQLVFIDAYDLNFPLLWIQQYRHRGP
jgi:peroxiredoxin